MSVHLWVPPVGGLLAYTSLRPRLAPRPTAPSVAHEPIRATEGGLP